jgi:cytochrome P450
MTQPSGIETLSLQMGANGEHPAHFAHHSTTNAGRCPVFRLPTLAGLVRVVSDREDVTRVLTDPAFGVRGVGPDSAITGGTLQGDFGLLRRDTPDIVDIRRLMGHFVSGAAVKEYRGAVEQAADDTTAELLARSSNGTANFNSAFSNRFIRKAAGVTMGIDNDQWRDLVGLSNATLAVLRTPGSQSQTVPRAWSDLYEFTAQLIERKRQQPDQLMLSRLIPALEARGVVGDELIQSVASLINGLPTVTDVLNSCVIELLRQPATVRACLKNPSLWKPTVEELLRYRAHFAFALPRMAYQDAKLGGVAITAGEIILPSLTGALHDPKHVVRPNRFDPSQTAKRNLAFGGGPHFCPGAALSRQWLEIGIKAAFSGLPDLRLDIRERDLFWPAGSLPVPFNSPVSWGPRRNFVGLLGLLRQPASRRPS